jgi:flagellar hook-associated protein 1 FlgK
MLGASSDAASAAAISTGLDQLQNTVDDSQTSTSPSALINDLSNALQQYAASPDDSTLAQGVLGSAQALATGLNSATATVQQVREQADAGMASAVSTINSLLTQFKTVNDSIVTGTKLGDDVTDDVDARNSILTQLSQQIGITTTTGPNNSMSIYTDSGVTLFDTIPMSVTFQPTTSYAAGTVGNSVFVDGVPVTNSSSPMAIKSGALAGLANLRDNVAVTYQSQLDEIARGLVDDFAESDQSTTPTLPTAPGLFTYPGAPAMPSNSLNSGLAASIEINPNVDPSQGGNLNLLRDGGIADPTEAGYDYNPTGAASFSGRIQQLIGNLSQTMSFDPSAGPDTSDSLVGYATASVSWLEATRQSADNQNTYQSTLASQTSQSLSSETGVNLDDEMSKMLDLENSYQASAKLLTTIDNIFTVLFQVTA